MELKFTVNEASKIMSWRVKEGAFVKKGHVIFEFAVQQPNDQEEQSQVLAGGSNGARLQRFKTTEAGVVRGILAKRGDIIVKGTPLLVLEPCPHPTVFSDMCGKCGADLAKLDTPSPGTTTESSYVSMIHSVPGLKVSLKDAKSIDKNEESHLLQQRQLRLLVDLDQTLIHTTNDNVPQNLRDVLHFQLVGHGSVWYHTRLRPGTRNFLEKISKFYQLHICTFGSRNYAHVIARHLDPSGKYFYNRILSRDECFSQNSKTANLKELFPNGDHMVCIIDDREDVWNYGPNLIHVKPYHFFRHTGDINAPPGFTKKDNDDKVGFDFTPADVQKKDKTSEPEEKIAIVATKECGEILKATPETETEKSVVIDPEKSEKKEVKDVTNDLLLSDDDDDDDESSSEEKANDGGSESSSEPTTESETDPDSQKLDKTLTEESEIEQKSNSLTEYTTEEVKGMCNTPELEVEKSSSFENETINIPRAISSSEKDKKEEGELSDSSLSLNDTLATPSTISELLPAPIVINTENIEEKSDIIEVEDEDDYLLYLEEILKQIHEAFYKIYDDMKERTNGQVPDVKNVIPYVRRKVLKGCSIVFSGVIPVDHNLEKSRPYLVAQSLGAQVSDKIIPALKGGPPSTSTRDIIPTTHVVAARLGTAKVNDARRYRGVHVVTPNWLWSCAERWEHVDEKLFALCKKSNVKRHPPAHCSSPESTLSQSRDDYEMLTPLESLDSDADAVFSVQSGSPMKPKNGQTPAARRGRTPSGRFMDTINPLFSFSMDDIESMGQEVDDICNESDSSSSDDEIDAKKEQVIRKKPKKISNKSFPELNNSVSILSKVSSSDTSDEEQKEEYRALGLRPRPRKRRLEPKTETETEDEPLNAKFRRGENLPSDMDVLNLTNASTDEEEGDDQEENSWMARALEEVLGEDSMDSNSKS